MINLSPFKAEHAEFLTAETEPGMMGILGENPAYWQAIEANGKAFSAFCDGTFLGVGGFCPMPWGSTAEVWVWALPEAKKYPVAVTKLILRMFAVMYEDYGVVRIQCVVRRNNRKAARWIRLLGFKKEATMKKYGPGGSDFWLFSRVKEQE